MKKPKRMISLEDKKKAVDFWKSGKTKKLSLTTVSNRYRFVTSLAQLYKRCVCIRISCYKNKMKHLNIDKGSKR
jgi:hypothetical protein